MPDKKTPSSGDGDGSSTDAPIGGGHASALGAAAPKDLKVKIAEQQLLIEWKDGQHSRFSLGKLRKVCPCATCRTEREKAGDNPLRILKSDPAGIHVISARLVGNYAIQFDWSDGHNTGIFDFRFLRSLDPPD